MENRPVNRAVESPAGGNAAGGVARPSQSAGSFQIPAPGAAQGADGLAPRLAQRAADSSLEGMSEARVDALARLLIRALDNDSPAVTQGPPIDGPLPGDDESQSHPGIALYQSTQSLLK
jgi:hypothetical protein